MPPHNAALLHPQLIKPRKVPTGKDPPGQVAATKKDLPVQRGEGEGKIGEVCYLYALSVYKHGASCNAWETNTRKLKTRAQLFVWFCFDLHWPLLLFALEKEVGAA